MEGAGWIGVITIGGLPRWIAERVMCRDDGIITNFGLGIVGALGPNAILMLVTGRTLRGRAGQLVLGPLGAMLVICVRHAVRETYLSRRSTVRRIVQDSRTTVSDSW